DNILLRENIMMYTVASTLPPDHAGRTKSLLKRIDFLNDEFDFDQTILTTNDNPNYTTVSKDFYNKGRLKKNSIVINIYDWLSNFILLTGSYYSSNTHINIQRQELNISNFIAKEDLDKNCVRYYDKH